MIRLLWDNPARAYFSINFNKFANNMAICDIIIQRYYDKFIF